MNYQALCDPALTYSPIFALQDTPLVSSLSSSPRFPHCRWLSTPYLVLFLFPVHYSSSLEGEVQSQTQSKIFFSILRLFRSTNVLNHFP